MVATAFLTKAWVGYNVFIGKVDHLDNLKSRIDNVIHSDNNIIKYKPNIYYETRVKSFDRILDKIKHKKTIPKDIYGLRIVYNLDNKDDEFMAYYIKYSIDKEFNKTYYYKDYISNPKDNNYKSLHMGVWDNNCLFDIQIRNIEMDYWAKFGGASDYHQTNQ